MPIYWLLFTQPFFHLYVGVGVGKRKALDIAKRLYMPNNLVSVPLFLYRDTLHMGKFQNTKSSKTLVKKYIQKSCSTIHDWLMCNKNNTLTISYKQYMHITASYKDVYIYVNQITVNYLKDRNKLAVRLHMVKRFHMVTVPQHMQFGIFFSNQSAHT